MTPNERAPDERDLECAREAYGRLRGDCLAIATLSARLSREREAARHEPAPVDVLLIEARTIAAGVWDQLGALMTAEAARKGTQDHQPMVRAILAALTRGAELHAEGKVK